MTEHAGGEESFTTYVAMRWSMLYRLAALLGGTAGAEGLTRAALVRARLGWSEIRESASIDDQLKRLLASAAVERGTATPDVALDRAGSDARSPRERLWDQVDSLAARPRALLVLRHYESFSDAEIAATVGGPPAAVSEELRALETGIDPADLRAELVLHSEQVTVPHPPVVALLEQARETQRQRRRRSWMWAAGLTAVAAALVLVAGLVDGAPDPAATHPADRGAGEVRFLARLPSGPPPRIAYSEGRSLRLGDGREIALGGVASSIVQTTKWLFVAYLSGEIARIDPVTGEVASQVQASQGGLVTDPSGEHLAWLAPGRGRAVVVLRTAADWAVQLSDEQEFPARPRCCDNPFVVDGITAAGQVVASLPAAHRTWVWSTPDAGTTTKVTDVSGLGGGVVVQVTPAGVVVRRAPSQYTLGVLEQGRFVATAALAARTADFSDPRGRRAVLVDENGETRVLEIAFGLRGRRGTQDVRMRLPAGTGEFTAARWEDDGHVLLDVADASVPEGALVRCAVDTGACEVAARFTGPHLLAR